ncbi:phosphodiesterase [Leptothoe sp. PORK10 BA2]|uniref:phosphodiesterase n=1 Tax=Leptothoe sp. PORK10 BA2 TaxID=3110254 RepID=UPI002B202195|nr:phosphodiesterase [Leptothoe sp. PORK10 BA2]MEA5465797.1 phosphodiesterase [Leptothoe sp. PORK10 BA2]
MTDGSFNHAPYPSPSMTIIAQISDLHVQAAGQLAYGVVDTHPLVQKAFNHLANFSPSPDVVVASGDLVQRGTAEEYIILKEMLAALPCPVYVMPGNHDNRENLRQILADHAYLPTTTGHLSYGVDSYPVRMLMLDTTIPGQGGGRIDGERLSWLDAQLTAAPHTPTLIFMHHPPFKTGIPRLDKNEMEGREALADLIGQHSQVERVSCGHLHRNMYRRWAGTIASAQPSLVHQGKLVFDRESTSLFTMEPPAYQFHVWANDTLVSHTIFVGDFDGPYRFSDGQKVVATGA